MILLAFLSWYEGGRRILPGVRVVGGESLAGMTRGEAEEVLEKIQKEYRGELTLGESKIEIPADIYNWKEKETVERALFVGREWKQEDWEYLAGRKELELEVEIHPEVWERWINQLAAQTSISGVPGQVEVVRNQVMVTNGEDGVELEKDRLKGAIELAAARRVLQVGEVPIRQSQYKLTEEERQELEERAGRLLGKKMSLEIDEERVSLADKELVGLLSAEPGELGEPGEEKIRLYIEGLAERYNREPQDAEFEFVEGKVKEFTPAKDGIKIIEGGGYRISEGIQELMQNIDNISVEIPVEYTTPKVTTEEVNSLGIVERIGRGDSYYFHSIANRVYNVALAAERVSRALIAPGEEFSFNQTVGEITAATGYRTAYVITNGRTELGDGGGVCQVSTTMFRAALNAGLPITERFAHAYRVGYYEQNAKPGLDATVYTPSKDLKFVNDTPGHILIQVTVDEPNRHLVIELYGTRDGRVSLLSPVRVWGESPPPPDLYQDDPSLPAGEIKQVDWAAWGAKTAFDYRVEREGETIFSKTFTSNFKPWQNVYLRGTGPTQ